ncbi:MAG TPA: ABC transporter substrate-binding protein [Methylophilaceae bacterium]|nr:ABC transporter substrate-binding protein [Methylophilaceae bacterium]
MLRVLVFLLSLTLAACAPDARDTDIRMALSQAPINLDPRYATDAASERVNRLLYRSLVDFDAHFKPAASLATWQQLDALHYRFKLGDSGRTFHDGSRLEATDVAVTYNSLRTLRDSPHATEYANIREVQAVDADTVEFTLDAPDDQFPARLIIGILPARLIAAKHDFSHQPLGSGPLRFVSWASALKLQRVSDGQGIVLSEVKDPTVRILKLMRGEVDLLQGDLPPELVRYLRKQPHIAVATSPGANFSYLGFNTEDFALQNPLVRRAVAHAIDRQAIIDTAMVEGTRVAGAILPPEHWAGNPNLVSYDYDPKEARSLLERAGIQLPLKLVYKTSTDAQRVRLATILQAQMRPAGIELEIRSLDWGTFFDDIKQGKFELYGLTWVGIKTPEIYRLAFHSQSIPPKGANRGRYRDPMLDALIDVQDWVGVTERVHQQLPYVPLWYEGQFAAMREGLIHYPLRPDGNWDGLATIERQYANQHAD